MRQPDVVMRAGDRLPTLRRTVSVDGVAVNLTGYTVVLKVINLVTGAALISAAATPDPDQTTNPGVVTYAFTAPDAAIAAGTYGAWFEATAGGTTLSVPNDGFLAVQILADGGAVWSYTGNPATRPVDAVRYLVGDTDPAAPKVLDAEIAWLLGEANGNTYQAAAEVAENMAAMASAAWVTSKSVGNLSISYAHKERADNYRTLAQRLRTRATRASITAPVAGGAVDVAAIFSIGMTDPAPSTSTGSPSLAWGV